MRKVKLAKFVLAPLALSLMVGMAQAKDVEKGWFIQGDIAQAESNEKSSSLRSEVSNFGDIGTAHSSQTRRAWKVSGGYRFNNYFALAVNYADLGMVELASSTGSNAIYQVEALSGGATGISGIANWPISESVNLHGKLGYAHLSAKPNRVGAVHGVNGGSNNDVFFGAGMSFDLTENLSLMVDWERYQFERETDLVSAGLRYTFGSVAKKKAVAVPTPPPKKVVQPMPEKLETVKPSPVPVMKPLRVNVYFDNNSSVLTSETKALLANVASQLTNDRIKDIEISGFASATGNAQYNQMLSMRRANAVSQYIENHWSVDGDKVSVNAFGEELAEEAATVSKARRVRVSIKFNNPH
ncbi:MAG: OmpA family protein [Psychrobium sp.]|nr:OmpA family protein [Psychrobium sp.]